MYNSNMPSRAELPSSKQLFRSTILALVAACFLLVTVVLPSEYGIDPTGMGNALGLAKMGEIKVALAAEAKADALQDMSMVSTQKTPVTAPAATPQAVAPQTVPVTATQAVPQQNTAPQVIVQAVTPQVSTPQVAPKKQDSMTITLRPGQGAEIKLVMRKNAAANYQWKSDGPVNVDVHGEPMPPAKGATHSYNKERQIQKGTGTLVAAFDGTHGWFWRNRTNKDITLQRTTTGEYQEMKRVI